MFLMIKTRAAHLGENYAALVNFVISKISADKQQDYRTRLVAELEKFSYTENIRELEHILIIDVEVPEELAKFIKENMNVYYQKDTARRVLTAILSDLK
jgi:transcriptional regulator with PAS, ATPase and Fis domain